MKLLYRSGRFNMPLLCEQLFEAFPNWTVVHSGVRKFLGKVVQTKTGVRITVPFDKDVLAAELLVDAHNWSDKSRNEIDQEKYRRDITAGKGRLRTMGFAEDEITALIGKD